MEHWWNDTERGKLWSIGEITLTGENRVWRIVRMILRGKTEYGALLE
jgi:hypothetical protein